VSEQFFRKFPVVRYGDFNAVDITRGVALLDTIDKNPFVFYPYEIAYGERPDQLSDRYYDDPYLSWLVYLSAGVYDPYYDWYMPDDEFMEYVTERYGTLAEAAREVRGYRCNWYEDDSVITPGRFSSLDVEEIKYWEPVRDERGAVTSYRRARRDWRRHTNRIVSYPVSGAGFVRGEAVSIVISAPSRTGKGFVARAASDQLVLQHLSGYYVDSVETPLSSATITGYSSGAVVALESSPTVLVELIKPEEQAYWSEVTALDEEQERNASKKSVRVMDKRLAVQASLDLSKALSDD